MSSKYSDLMILEALYSSGHSAIGDKFYTNKLVDYANHKQRSKDIIQSLAEKLANKTASDNAGVLRVRLLREVDIIIESLHKIEAFMNAKQKARRS